MNSCNFVNTPQPKEDAWFASLVSWSGELEEADGLKVLYNSSLRLWNRNSRGEYNATPIKEAPFHIYNCHLELLVKTWENNCRFKVEDWIKYTILLVLSFWHQPICLIRHSLEHAMNLRYRHLRVYGARDILQVILIITMIKVGNNRIQPWM